MTRREVMGEAAGPPVPEDDDASPARLGCLQARGHRIGVLVDEAAVERLLMRAETATAMPRKVVWLQRAADVLARAVEASGAAACRAGCSHCCHIAVPITRAEARHIAVASRRRAVDEPAQAVTGPAAGGGGNDGYAQRAEAFKANSQARYTGRPCPFLHGGRCSISGPAARLPLPRQPGRRCRALPAVAGG